MPTAEEVSEGDAVDPYLTGGSACDGVYAGKLWTCQASLVFDVDRNGDSRNRDRSVRLTRNDEGSMCACCVCVCVLCLWGVQCQLNDKPQPLPLPQAIISFSTFLLGVSVVWRAQVSLQEKELQIMYKGTHEDPPGDVSDSLTL